MVYNHVSKQTWINKFLTIYKTVYSKTAFVFPIDATLDLLLAPVPDEAIKPPNRTRPQKIVCDDHITHGKKIKPLVEKVNMCDPWTITHYLRR